MGKRKVSAAVLATLLTLSGAPALVQADSGTPTIQAQERYLKLKLDEGLTIVSSKFLLVQGNITFVARTEQDGNVLLPYFSAERSFKVVAIVQAKEAQTNVTKQFLFVQTLNGKQLNETQSLNIAAGAKPLQQENGYLTFESLTNNYTAFQVTRGTFVNLEEPLKEARLIRVEQNNAYVDLVSVLPDGQVITTQGKRVYEMNLRTATNEPLQTTKLKIAGAVLEGKPISNVYAMGEPIHLELDYNNKWWRINTVFFEDQYTYAFNGYYSKEVLAMRSGTGLSAILLVKDGDYTRSLSEPTTYDLYVGNEKVLTKTTQGEADFGTEPKGDYLITATTMVDNQRIVGYYMSGKPLIQFANGETVNEWTDALKGDSYVWDQQRKVQWGTDDQTNVFAQLNVTTPAQRTLPALVAFRLDKGQPLVKINEPLLEVTTDANAKTSWFGVALAPKATYLVPASQAKFLVQQQVGDTLKIGTVSLTKSGTLSLEQVAMTHTFERNERQSFESLGVTTDPFVQKIPDTTQSVGVEVADINLANVKKIVANRSFSFTWKEDGIVYEAWSPFDGSVAVPKMSGYEAILQNDEILFHRISLTQLYISPQQPFKVEVFHNGKSKGIEQFTEFPTKLKMKLSEPGEYDIHVTTVKGTETYSFTKQSYVNFPSTVTTAKVRVAGKEYTVEAWKDLLRSTRESSLAAQWLYETLNSATGKKTLIVTPKVTKTVEQWRTVTDVSFNTDQYVLLRPSSPGQELAVKLDDRWYDALNFRMAETLDVEGIFVPKNEAITVAERTKQGTNGYYYTKTLTPTSDTVLSWTDEERQANLYTVKLVGSQKVRISGVSEQNAMTGLNIAGGETLAIKVDPKATKLFVDNYENGVFYDYAIQLPYVATQIELKPIVAIKATYVNGKIDVIGKTSDAQQEVTSMISTLNALGKLTIFNSKGERVKELVDNLSTFTYPLQNGTYKLVYQLPGTTTSFETTLKVGQETPTPTPGGGGTVTPTPTPGGGGTVTPTPTPGGGGTVVTPPVTKPEEPKKEEPKTEEPKKPVDANQQVVVKPNEPAKVELTKEQKEAAKEKGFEVKAGSVALKVPAKAAQDETVMNFTIEQATKVKETDVAANVKKVPAWTNTAQQIVELKAGDKKLSEKVELRVEATSGTIVKLTEKNGKLYAIPQQTTKDGDQLVTNISEFGTYAVVTPPTAVKPIAVTKNKQTTYTVPATKGTNVYYTTDAKLVAGLQTDVNLEKWKKANGKVTVKQGAIVYMVVEKDGLLSVVQTVKK